MSQSTANLREALARPPLYTPAYRRDLYWCAPERVTWHSPLDLFLLSCGLVIPAIIVLATVLR